MYFVVYVCVPIGALKTGYPLEEAVRSMFEKLNMTYEVMKDGPSHSRTVATDTVAPLGGSRLQGAKNRKYTALSWDGTRRR